VQHVRVRDGAVVNGNAGGKRIEERDVIVRGVNQADYHPFLDPKLFR
jgi:hypothetical protein